MEKSLNDLKVVLMVLIKRQEEIDKLLENLMERVNKLEEKV